MQANNHPLTLIVLSSSCAWPGIASKPVARRTQSGADGADRAARVSQSRASFECELVRRLSSLCCQFGLLSAQRSKMSCARQQGERVTGVGSILMLRRSPESTSRAVSRSMLTSGETVAAILVHSRPPSSCWRPRTLLACGQERRAPGDTSQSRHRCSCVLTTSSRDTFALRVARPLARWPHSRVASSRSTKS